MYYKNFFTRFVFRRNFRRRLYARINRLKRKVSKDEFTDMADLYRALGREARVIIDAGANIGFVTHQFRRHFPSATIHAFEPNPSVFSKLEASYSTDTRVVTRNAGVGERSGYLTFYINSNSGTSSFLKPTEYHQQNFARKVIEEKEVAVINIGAYMEDNGLDHVDILKLDVEGYELATLRGIERLPERVDMIYTEVNLIPSYEGQPLIEDVTAYLRQNGFHLVNFYGINENPYHQAMITNLLFISEQIRSDLEEKLGARWFGYA